MTAILAFTQGNSAWLLADSAKTRSDGVMVDRKDKVLRVNRLRAALCWTGTEFGERFEDDASWSERRERIERAFKDLGHPIDTLRSQGELMGGLSQVLRHMHESNRRAAPLASEAAFNVRIVVALWHQRSNEPRIYLADTDAIGGGAPYQFHRMRSFVTGRPGEVVDDVIARSLGRSADLGDPTSFDPIKDGFKVLDAQRQNRILVGNIEADYLSVGGRAYSNQVTAAGIKTKLVHEWPDKVGEPIKP